MLDKAICIIKEHDGNVGLRCSRNGCKHKCVIEAAGFKSATPLEYAIQKIVD